MATGKIIPGNAKKMVKLEVARPEILTFDDVGDFVVGEVRGIRTITTKLGEAEILDVNIDGQVKSMIISSSLKFYPWDRMTGEIVKIEFEGEKKNQKSGRYFKSYAVYVYEDTAEKIQDDDTPF